MKRITVHLIGLALFFGYEFHSLKSRQTLYKRNISAHRTDLVARESYNNSLKALSPRRLVLKTVLLQASIANFPKSFPHLSIIHVLTRQVLYSLVSECHSSLPTNTIPNSLAISRSSCSSPLKTLHSDQMFINLRSSFLKTLNILFCIPDRAWPSPRTITLSSTSLTARRTSSRRI